MTEQNQMYKYEYFVDRELERSIEWLHLLHVTGLDSYGMDLRGNGFENDTFAIRPYNWANENDTLPNFEFKPSGFKIEWYKYPFRAAQMNRHYTNNVIQFIFNQCIESLYHKELHSNNPNDTMQL